jgi:hypothetical protein
VKSKRVALGCLAAVAALMYLNHPNSRFNRQKFERDCARGGIAMPTEYKVLDLEDDGWIKPDPGYYAYWAVRSKRPPSISGIEWRPPDEAELTDSQKRQLHVPSVSKVGRASNEKRGLNYEARLVQDGDGWVMWLDVFPSTGEPQGDALQ